MQRDVGQPTDVKGDDDMLEQAESLDSDEVRNDDGDEVVDPTDEWLATDDNESLDDKLAAEVPGHGVALGLVSEEDLDRTDPPEHGSSSGQIDTTTRGRQFALRRSKMTLRNRTAKWHGTARDPTFLMPHLCQMCFGSLRPGHCGSTLTRCRIPTNGSEDNARMDSAMNVESKSQADPSIGELVSQLSSQTSRLVRDEMKLAQNEFREAAKHAGLGAGLLSVAGLLAVLGLATFVASAIAALSLVLPLWAAAVIIGIVLSVAAGIAGLISKKEVERTSPVPQQTLANVKQDIDEVKEARHDRR